MIRRSETRAPKTSVTIITDASHARKTRPETAGCGIWMKGDRTGGSLAVGFPLRVTTPGMNSTYYELRALACGLWLYARRFGPPRAGEEIMLQSDSLHALCLVRDRLPDRATLTFKHGDRPRHVPRPGSVSVKHNEDALNWIEDNTRGAILKLRWVKGHGGPDARGRFYVNELCDDLAKRARRSGTRVDFP